VDWDWQNPRSTASGGRSTSARLSGTYRLSASDSDDPRSAADRVLANVSSAERTRILRQIENRLTPPDVIAIDRVGSRVRVASSSGPEVTFDATGESRVETGPRGRSTTTRASAYGDRIEVATSGSGGSDFSVTFEPLDNGDRLRVTRRLYNDALDAPVTVRSEYRRSSDTADWTVYRDTRSTRTASSRGTIVPTGTTFVATLDRAIGARSSRDGDPVTLTVTEGPSEFRNGVIDGYVTLSSASSSDSHRGLGIDFDRIRLSDGRTAAFAGSIDAIRDPDGREIAFDRADPGADQDRTNQAIQRGAIGAAVGAVIGAVIGGGKGAAIGAGGGAGGGAGTVFIDDRSATELPRGTEFTIRSGTIELQ
jgi:hypothetical protein